MASIDRRPGGQWRARWREYPNGPQRSKHFTRKIDAQRFLVDVQHQLDRGVYVDPAAARTLLEVYAEAWLARMTPTWRPNTASSVASSLRTHVLPVLGRRPVGSIKKSDVEALYASLHLAPSTVALVHQHTRQLLAAAIEDGLTVRNAAMRARLPRRDDARAQPVPLELVERITEHLPSWLRAAVPLGLGVGLRQSEATGLRAGRVDFLRRQLRVDAQLSTRQGPAVLVPPKSASSFRTVPLGDVVANTLAAHLRRFPPTPDELVLRTPTGKPVNDDRFGYHWRTAARAAGAGGVRFHDLRHTFAATLLSRGVSVKAVATWLGHASAATTLSTYAHLMPADEDVARSVLDDLLLGSAEDQLRTNADPGTP